MCTTTTHYETHISTECSRGGSAICDGFCELHGVECTCWCHDEDHADRLPNTVEGVLRVHDQENDVVTRFTASTVEALTRLVTDEINYLTVKHGDTWRGVRGAQFRASVSSTGTGYVYVVFS
jgi:hypothetical protein